MIINFEGIDHSFKETNSLRLYELFDSFISTRIYSFPDYTSHAGKLIYKILHGEIEATEEERFRLYFDDKNAVSDIIANAKFKNDKVVITDRYKYSNLVYNYHLRDTEVYKMEQMLPEPDLNIYLDMDPELIKEKLYERSNGEDLDMYESNISLLKEKREIYLSMMGSLSNAVIVKVFNEDGTFRSKDEIFKDITNSIRSRFPDLEGM